VPSFWLQSIRVGPGSPQKGCNMASKEQIEANRANSKRSTGPRTPIGKSRSSLNAVKHGLSAREIVVWDEDPLDFEKFRAEVKTDLSPVGIVQYELADQIAAQFWRIRRVARLEAVHLDTDKRGVLSSMLQVADADTRMKVMERLRSLQRDRSREEPVSVERAEIGFSADFAQALYSEMPEMYTAVMEDMKNKDTPGELAKLARHEGRLRNDLYRMLALYYSLRGAQSKQVRTREP
jgi:hypothetical protein